MSLKSTSQDSLPSVASADALFTPEAGSDRRNFFKKLGGVGIGTTAAMLFGDLPLAKGQSTAANQDAINDILTAAVIAEDLATTFYFNGLVGSVVMDAKLAGPGGSAVAPTSSGQSLGNLAYLRAALNQEIAHANLLRTVANLGSSAATDPYQTFYFPATTFSDLTTFLATLDALENAFIGAYLNAVRELSMLASRSAVRGVKPGTYGAAAYSTAQLSYVAAVAASILGVEAEHRALGRVISQAPPTANNLYFEQTDGLTSVYHGSNSAVVALTPFLSASNGQGYSLSTAVSGAATVGLASSTSNPPAE